MKRISSDKSHDTIMGWVIISPSGAPIWGTFAETRDACWGIAFNLMPSEFVTAYYKKWDASIRAAAKMGYSFSRCTREYRTCAGALEMKK